MLTIYIIGCICVLIGSYVKLIAVPKDKRVYSVLAVILCTLVWPVLPVGVFLVTLLGVVLFGVNGVIYLFNKDEKRWNKHTNIDIQIKTNKK